MNWAVPKFKFFILVFCFIVVFSLSKVATAQVDSLKLKENAQAQTHVEPDSDKTDNTATAELDFNKLIHFGDLIDVDIVGSTEYDWRGTITNEGFLSGLNFTEKEIYALCKNGDYVAKQIAKSFSTFLNDPEIVVTILDRSNRPMTTLFGAVSLPQKFKIRREVRLNELIVLAGGFTEKASGEIQILRQTDASCIAKFNRETENSKINNSNNLVEVSQEFGSKIIKVKISDLISGKKNSNLQVLYGDIVTVIASEPIYVIGGVVNPTKISVREKINVTRAIATAGGLTKKTDKMNITIFRRENGNTKLIKVDLSKIETGEEFDIELNPYDIVDVKENGRDVNKYPPIVNFREIVTGTEKDLPVRIID